MWQTLPQIGLYTNGVILSILYEKISCFFSGFMQLFDGKTAVRRPGRRAPSESPGRPGGHLRPSGTGLRCPGRLLTPRALRQGPESPGTAGRPCGPSGPARVTRSSWSTPRSFGHGPVSPWSAARPRGSSDPSAIRQGKLVEPASPQTRVRGARDNCATPRAVGLRPEACGTVGPPCGPSDQGPSPRDSWLAPRYIGYGPKSSGTAGRPRALRPGPEWPGTPGRPRGPSDPDPSHPGMPVDAAGLQTQARVSRDGWSTPRALGPGLESPRTSA